jgi:hypothetical protein
MDQLMIGHLEILEPLPDPIMPIGVEEDDALTRTTLPTKTTIEHEEHILRYFLSLVNHVPSEVQVGQLVWVIEWPEVDDRPID